MKYKYTALLALTVLFFSLNLSGEEKKVGFAASMTKWNQSQIKEYYMKINYTSLSPISGIWELKVKNGKIIDCMFNGKPAENCTDTAGTFTMENLYKTAGRSLSADNNGPFIIRVTYGKNSFIKSLARVRNPGYKKSVQKDTTYSIDVIDFIPGGA